MLYQNVINEVYKHDPLITHDPQRKPESKTVKLDKLQDKKILILELSFWNADGSENKADNNKYYPFKIVEDNTNSYKEICKRHNAKSVWKCFVFPPEIDAKKLMNKLTYKYHVSYDEINNVLEAIRSLNPKKILK